MRYIFLPAGIKDFSGVYAHGLPDAALLGDGAGHDHFWHIVPS